MKRPEVIFSLFGHLFSFFRTAKLGLINMLNSLSLIVKSIIFITLSLTAIKAQALPLDSTCRFKLLPSENLDTVVDLAVNSELDFEKRVQTLFVYIKQTSPNLISDDIEEILEFILLNERYTDFEVEPANLFQFLKQISGLNSANPNARLQARDLSMQSQILLWLLNIYIKDYSTIENAILVGNIHRFILEDIKRLRPGRSHQHYNLVLTRLLSSHLP